MGKITIVATTRGSLEVYGSKKVQTYIEEASQNLGVQNVPAFAFGILHAVKSDRNVTVTSSVSTEGTVFVVNAKAHFLKNVIQNVVFGLTYAFEFTGKVDESYLSEDIFEEEYDIPALQDVEEPLVLDEGLYNPGSVAFQ